MFVMVNHYQVISSLSITWPRLYRRRLTAVRPEYRPLGGETDPCVGENFGYETSVNPSRERVGFGSDGPRNYNAKRSSRFLYSKGWAFSASYLGWAYSAFSSWEFLVSCLDRVFSVPSSWMFSATLPDLAGRTRLNFSASHLDRMFLVSLSWMFSATLSDLAWRLSLTNSWSCRLWGDDNRAGSAGSRQTICH